MNDTKIILTPLEEKVLAYIKAHNGKYNAEDVITALSGYDDVKSRSAVSNAIAKLTFAYQKVKWDTDTAILTVKGV